MNIPNVPEPTIHIGFLNLSLYLPESQSLKNKRWFLKSLKDKIRAKYNVSIAEVGETDKWQQAFFGICMVGPDKSSINSCLDNILSFIEAGGEVKIINHRLEFL